MHFYSLQYLNELVSELTFADINAPDADHAWEMQAAEEQTKCIVRAVVYYAHP